MAKKQVPEKPQIQPAEKKRQDTLLNGDAGVSTEPKSLVGQDADLKTLGRYQVLGELGRGGMGAVYLADDTKLKRQVALKIPQFEASKAEQMRARFEREAQMAAQLSHPNICQVYDVAEIDGRLVMSMEYIPGKTMAAYTKTGKLLSDRQAVTQIRKVALAVEAAHQKGMIHRDLKPGNIMLCRPDPTRKTIEPKVMDFGLAKSFEANATEFTKSGMIVGTPCYMSKEQWSARDVKLGPQCDVYSLGIILYELLTGKLPFDVHPEEPPTAWFVKLVTESPIKVSDRKPDIDAALEVIVMKAIAVEPINRYASMAAFGEALEDWLKGKTVSGQTQLGEEIGELNLNVKPVTRSFGRGKKPPKSRSAIAGYGGAAALILLGIILTIRKPDGSTQKVTTSGDTVTIITDSGDVISVSADENNPAPNQSDNATGDDAAWTPLFDGRTLTGWHGDPTLWTVSLKDGAIVGTSDGTLTHNSCLVCDRPYSDFVLKLKFKLHEHQGNSGVQFRSEEVTPDAAIQKYTVHGYQADIIDVIEKMGQLYDEGGGRKTIAAAPSSTRTRLAQSLNVDGWNELVIEANGRHVRQTINGIPTVDIEDPSGPDSGVIALQLHQGKPMKVSFKDIVIAPLEKDSQQWTSLFDGTDVSAWQTLGPFSIQDGLLVADRDVGCAFSKAEYSDFELIAEWRLSAGGNSGIYYRADATTSPGLGTEYQLGDNSSVPNGSMTPDKKTGALYAVHAPETPANVRSDWNTTRIVCRGTYAEHWLNGKLLLTYDTASDLWKELLRKSALKPESYGLVAGKSKGHLLLQRAAGEIAFRSIRIRELSPSVRPFVVETGFTPIFNGKDFSGWEGDFSKWSVKDEAIVLKTDELSASTYLLTGKDYGDFELRLQFRLLNQGNSGVQFRTRRINDGTVIGHQAEIGYSSLDKKLGEPIIGDLWGQGMEQPWVFENKSAQRLEIDRVYRSHDWNDMVIRCDGAHETVQINGLETASLFDQSAPESGRIGLQGTFTPKHPSYVPRIEFRRLRIKEYATETVQTSPLSALDGSIPRPGSTWTGTYKVTNPDTPVGQVATAVVSHADSGGFTVRVTGERGIWDYECSPEDDHFRIAKATLIQVDSTVPTGEALIDSSKVTCDGKMLKIIYSRPVSNGTRLVTYELTVNDAVGVPTISTTGDTGTPSPSVDVVFQKGSIWSGENEAGKLRLTLIDRNADSFVARFEVGPMIVRRVSGIVKGGKLSWLASDVVAEKGKAGGNNSGIFSTDGNIHKIDFEWNDSNRTGNFSLTLEAGSMAVAPKPSWPDDSVSYRGNHYKAFADNFTWHGAKLECERLGGHLAVVTNAAENEFVFQLAAKAGLSETWLGATDEEVERKWVWLNSATSRFSAWNDGQPNDKASGEHYLMLVVNLPTHPELNGKWCDQPSRAEALHHPGFICEWER